ncbi:hypothetical protein [Azospirillum argentinense]
MKCPGKVRGGGCRLRRRKGERAAHSLRGGAGPVAFGPVRGSRRRWSGY